MTLRANEVEEVKFLTNMIIEDTPDETPSGLPALSQEEAATANFVEPKENPFKAFVRGAGSFFASTPTEVGIQVQEFGSKLENKENFWDKVIGGMASMDPQIRLEDIHKINEEIPKARKEFFEKSEVDERIERLGRNIVKSNKEYLENNRELWARPDEGFNKVIFDLGSGSASLATAIGAAAITRSPSSVGVLFGLKQRGSVLDAALEAGVDADEASTLATMAGVIEGGLEAVGVNIFMRNYSSMLKNVINRSASEFFQESAQELGDIFIRSKFQDPGTFQEIISQAAYAGTLGLVLGGGASMSIDFAQQSGLRKNLEAVGVPKEESGPLATNLILKMRDGIATSKEFKAIEKHLEKRLLNNKGTLSWDFGKNKNVKRQQFEEWIDAAQLGDETALKNIQEFEKVNQRAFNILMRKIGFSGEDIRGFTESLADVQVDTSQSEEVEVKGVQKPEVSQEEVQQSAPSISAPFSLEEGGIVKYEQLNTAEDYQSALDKLNAIRGNVSEELLDAVANIQDKLEEGMDKLLSAGANKEIIKKPKQAPRKRPKTPSFQSFVRKMGLSLQEMRNSQAQVPYAQNVLEAIRFEPRVRAVVRNDGQTVQKVAEAAKEHGFITDADIEKAGSLTDAFMEKFLEFMSGREVLTYEQQEDKATTALEERYYNQEIRQVGEFVGRTYRNFIERLRVFEDEMADVSIDRLEDLVGGSKPAVNEDVLKIPERPYVYVKGKKKFLIGAKEFKNLQDDLRRRRDAVVGRLRERLQRTLKETRTKEKFQERRNRVEELRERMVTRGAISGEGFANALTRVFSGSKRNLSNMEPGDYHRIEKEIAREIWLEDLKADKKDSVSDITEGFEQRISDMQAQDRNRVVSKSESVAAKEQARIKEGRGVEAAPGVRPRRTKINMFNDMRYIMQQLARHGGGDMDFIYMRMMRDYHISQREVADINAELENLGRVVPDFKSQSGLEKIISKNINVMTEEDWRIVEDIMTGEIEAETVHERYGMYADFFSRVLKDYESKVKYLQARDYVLYGERVKNAPVEDLEEAKRIYLETPGAFRKNALLEYVKDKDWGIRADYSPQVVFQPSIQKGSLGIGEMGRGHIKSRRGVDLGIQDRTINSRFRTYIRQINNLFYLEEHMWLVDEEWAKIAHRFENKGAIQGGLEKVFNTMKGYTDFGGDTEQILQRIARVAYATVFMQPRLALRNLHQNIAFYPNHKEFVKFLNEQAALKIGRSDQNTWTEGRQKFFDTYISQDIKKHLLLLYEVSDLGGDTSGRFWKAVNEINSIYEKSDRVNRWMAFGAKMKGLDEVFSDEVINDPKKLKEALWKNSFFKGATLEDRREILRMYNLAGLEAYKRKIAQKLVENIHFVYDRSQRSPSEQGFEGRTLVAMLTFSKSNISFIAKSIETVDIYGKESEEAKQAMYQLFMHTVFKATAANIVYRFLTGDMGDHERDPDNPISMLGFLMSGPYSLLNILAYTPGGLTWGSLNQVAQGFQAILKVASGQEGAMKEALEAMATTPKTFLPFYKMFIQVAEAVFGHRRMEKLWAREMYSFINKEYSPDRNQYSIDRTLREAVQHAFFGTNASSDRVKQDKKSEKKAREEWNTFRKVAKEAGVKLPARATKYNGYKLKSRIQKSEEDEIQDLIKAILK